MNTVAFDRLFKISNALDHPVTRGITILVGVAFVIAVVAAWMVNRSPKASDDFKKDIADRVRSWCVLIPIMGVPVLLGAAWTIAAIGLLSLLCYREFARATGLFREKLISLLVVLGILAVTFAAADHWYGLFAALPPLMLCFIAAVPIIQDQPKGFIQRVGLGVLAFMLFGVGLGHLAYFANDTDYRPIIAMLFFTVEMNDIFAYCVGKTIGGPKLAPNTSPNKTISGSLGALVLTTALAAILAHFIFRGGPLDQPVCLLTLGLIIALGGQLGDLMISSVKRDVGIKDMGTAFPGHGGFLDRFNSMLLVAPAVFHYVGYFRGVGIYQPVRLFTGD